MSKYPYLDPSLSPAERAADLLSRLTLEEKVGQLLMLDGRDRLEEQIRTKTPGAFLHILGEDARRAIDASLSTRMAIPPLIAEDCIHGHSFWKGATIFPTQIALACSWNPALLRDVARTTAAEAAPTGVHWTFSPVLCLARDLRWGRVGETFGEDPHLIAELASAMIAGYQGDGLSDPAGILATAKHFAGYSETQGGRDASEADLSRRKLSSYFLPPFRKAALAGCMAFMTGYQSIEGVPSTANRWLLHDVLRTSWGFRGILVTDWDNVGRLVWEQQVCEDYATAAAVAVRAGNDLMMATPGFFEGALEAVRRGALTETEIDSPARRVLELKFAMGLFEDPRRPNLARAREVVGIASHRQTALRAARESIVLLCNDGTLPLREPTIRSIAVIGPNADDPLAQLGDWSLGSSQLAKEAGTHPRECTVTILDGLRRLAPQGVRVDYARACEVTDPSTSGVAQAAALAAKSDVAVVVLGDHLPFVGECLSTATLELQGGQKAVLDAVAASGTPFILVLVASKPLVLPPSAARASAVLCLFNPGMEGGTAFAEILWGRINPSGRLPISFPRHVGQQPVHYAQVRGQHGNRYADLTQDPLFAFGEGLSFTTFRYDSLVLESPQIAVGDPCTLSVTITNTGPSEGAETIQVYVTDDVTSATWVNRALKAFRKVTLAPGETRSESFTLSSDAFAIINAAGDEAIEPGSFTIAAGPSSRPESQLRAKLAIR